MPPINLSKIITKKKRIKTRTTLKRKKKTKIKMKKKTIIKTKKKKRMTSAVGWTNINVVMVMVIVCNFFNT
jgi:hypothetical protein